MKEAAKARKGKEAVFRKDYEASPCPGCSIEVREIKRREPLEEVIDDDGNLLENGNLLRNRRKSRGLPAMLKEAPVGVIPSNFLGV